MTRDALPLLIGRSRLLYKIPKDKSDSFDAWMMNAISNSAINGARQDDDYERAVESMKRSYEAEGGEFKVINQQDN